jgi:DNA-binding NarL/FixJ family response regulator
MHFIIADDHPFTLQGTKAYVESLGYVVLDTATNGKDAFRLIKTLKPEIAILDISMPDMNGLDILQQVSDYKMSVKIIFITTHREISIYKKATELGVWGYILKNYAEQELEDCISHVIAGKPYASPQLSNDLEIDNLHIKNETARKLSFIENKILQLIAQQKTTKQIAELLFLSEKTVEAHRTSIIEKLGLPHEKNVLMKWAINMQ